MTVLALASAMALGMATAAQAQNTRANNPEVEPSAGQPSNGTAPTTNGAAPQQRNMGTTGQGSGAPAGVQPGNGSNPAGAGRVNRKDQQ
jgi:hypothetical protein